MVREPVASFTLELVNHFHEVLLFEEVENLVQGDAF